MFKNAKYELTDTNERPLGPNVRLLRLKALRDIGTDVKAGDLGGLVGGPGSLSEHGDCWVYPEAIVYGGATMWDNARVRGTARVLGQAKLEGDCCIDGTAQVLAHFSMGGNSRLEDVQIVSLMVKAAGQYTANGRTLFCFDCLRNDREGTVRLEIPSSRCVPYAEAALALTKAGDRLSYVMYRGDVYPLAVAQYDDLRCEQVERLIASIQDGTHWQSQGSPLMTNVIYLT